MVRKAYCEALAPRCSTQHALPGGSYAALHAPAIGAALQPLLPQWLGGIGSGSPRSPVGPDRLVG